MKYLYAVSFVFQHTQFLNKVQSCTVMFEGVKGWDTEQVLVMGRFELPKLGITIDEGFKEVLASWSVAEIGG